MGLAESLLMVAALSLSAPIEPASIAGRKEMNMVDESEIARNEKVVRELYDCIQHNRSDGFEKLVSADHQDRSNGRNGPAGFIAAADNLHRAYSDFTISIEAVVASGDLVVVQWRERGMHTCQFFNLKPTGKPFESTGLNMYRLRNGQVVESWIAVDPKTFRAQMEAQAALAAKP